ncbi:putative DNA helicase ino80 [Naganishia albida]|nr:putative DNA helicase ino80 [Naganishia albida]
MAYRDPAAERNPPPFPTHERPMDPSRPQPPPHESPVPRDAWRPSEEDRYATDDYPRHPETAEWARRSHGSNGGRDVEREREVYMLERERELREREKQRDAWYRHAQGLGQQSSGRLEREREEWERERARVREDEYRVSEARQREEGEYPRVLADPRANHQVTSYPGPSSAARRTVSPSAYTTTVRRPSYDFPPRNGDDAAGFPYYPSPASTQRELTHRDPAMSAASLRALGHRVSGPQNLPPGSEDRAVDPHHYSTTDYHRLSGHAYAPSDAALTPGEIEAQRRQRGVEPRQSVGMGVMPVAPNTHSARSVAAAAAYGYSLPYAHPEAGYAVPYDPRQYPAANLPAHAYQQAVMEREEREMIKYQRWQDQKRARLEELMEMERKRRARAAARHGLVGGAGLAEAIARNGDHLAPESNAPSRSHTPVEAGAVGDLRRHLKAQHKSAARARKEAREEAAAAAAIAARQRTDQVESRYTSPNHKVDELDDELMDLAGEEGSVFGASVAGPGEGGHTVGEASSTKKASRRKDKPKILSETELPQEDWPTKGLRNKDGSFRKKPGPPKGVKKGAALGKAGAAGAVESQAADTPGSEHIRAGASIGDALHTGPAAPASKRRKVNGKVKVEEQADGNGHKESSPYEDLSSMRPADVDSELVDMLGDRSPNDTVSRPDVASMYSADDPLARSLSAIEQSRRLLQDLSSRPESQQPEIQMRTKNTRKKVRDRDGSATNRNATESPRAGSTDVKVDFQGGMPGRSEIPSHASFVHDRSHQDDVQERPWEQPLQVQSSLVPRPRPQCEDLPLPAVEASTPPESAPGSRLGSPVQPSFEDTYGVDERDELSPPPREPINNAVARRRHLTVEAMQSLIWQDLACNQIPTVSRYVGQVITARQDNAKKIADALARQVKKIQVKQPPTITAIRQKARTAAKAATAYWKKAEKEEVELRKKAEREALDRARVEEAERERQRAAKRLQFLLDSGETYSKLMMKKIKTDEAMEEGGDVVAEASNGKRSEGDSDEDGGDAEDVDFDMDAPELKRRAAARARAIMARKKREAADFDEEVAVSTAALDFQNPLGAGVGVMVTQPTMLQAQLKDYQMRGLSWLAHLYESGINGILADEMGLGKTIQSISLLAWLAETHNIWGPFLVVAPTSTVHNWQAELTRFVPRLKVLPHWGTPADREVIRRQWSRPSVTFTEDAPFHIVVTSYDMVNVDTQYFKKVRWQYMVLDEAQAVKNAGTQRWTNLLSLKSRNRLLLTGTPIQNNMGELWALLHFIMPDLFTSLQDFTQWFSRGIEDGAGRKNDMLQAQQLRRLHDVLRPFMLRRVKRNVQSELGEKIEKDILVNLSPRQHMMYRALRSNASIKAILDQAKESSDTSTKRNALMNVVMQFRKVCNHPELFDRADVTAPLSFSTFSSSGDLLREQSLYLPDSCRNPIQVQLPRIVWEEGGVVDRPMEQGKAGFETKYLYNLMNIWSPDNLVKSLEDTDSAFGFLAITRDSVADLSRKAREPAIVQLMRSDLEALEQRNMAAESAHTSPFMIETKLRKRLIVDSDVPPHQIALRTWQRSYLSRTDARFTLEEVVAPPIRAECSSRSFNIVQQDLKDPLLDKLALYGLPPVSSDDPALVAKAQNVLPDLPPSGLLRNSSLDQQPVTSMRFPSMKRLIFDSAKLARLDSLLRELKAGGHRVLIYFQMTKMMSIFEEYLVYRQHRYLRLDGATAIADRRDMVNAWQTNPDIFIFMLSTRAGGLGINLTAADTVIFYEHDWNPSNDAQAMDRAHRVGQTRQVTVYRLICRGTVDERMLTLARNKKDVQDIVVGNKSLDEVNAQKEIASLLLDDEDDAGDMPATFGNRSAGFGSTFASSALADVDDEDGFFSNKKTGDDDGGEGSAPRAKSAVKRKAAVDEDGEPIKRPPKKRVPKPPAAGQAPKSKKAKATTAKSEPPSEMPSNTGTPEHHGEAPGL